MGMSLWQTMLLRHRAEGASSVETTISGHNVAIDQPVRAPRVLVRVRPDDVPLAAGPRMGRRVEDLPRLRVVAAATMPGRCADCGSQPGDHRRLHGIRPGPGVRERGFPRGVLRRAGRGSRPATSGSAPGTSSSSGRCSGTSRTAGSFLEIGCGTGFVLSGIHAADPVDRSSSGSEIFSAGLGFAADARPFGALLRRWMPATSRSATSSTSIGAFDVLEHIDDDEAVHRRGRAGPCGPVAGSWPRSRSTRRSGARRTSTPIMSGGTRRRELRRKVEAAGFEVVRMTSFVSLLLPMLVALALRTRGRTTDDGVRCDR